MHSLIFDNDIFDNEIYNKKIIFIFIFNYLLFI